MQDARKKEVEENEPFKRELYVRLAEKRAKLIDLRKERGFDYFGKFEEFKAKLVKTVKQWEYDEVELGRDEKEIARMKLNECIRKCS